jgi:hypothetical protein
MCLSGEHAALNNKPFPAFLKRFQVRHGLGTMRHVSKEQLPDGKLDEILEYLGLIDWLAIPAGTRAKRVGLLHAGSNVLAIAGFAIVCWLRYSTGRLETTTTLFAIEVVSLLLGALGGWLGGELVDRLGVGVDNGANLDAPNSLSGRPAKGA